MFNVSAAMKKDTWQKNAQKEIEKDSWTAINVGKKGIFTKNAKEKFDSKYLKY